MRRALLLLLGGMVLAGCTERLTTPGECPALCPGGSPVIRDTVLTALVDGDSSFTGYYSVTDPASLLISNGGSLGETRAMIRFIRRGDSVLVADTLRPFTIDSVELSVFLQERDTTNSPSFLDVYRLPPTFDSTTTFAEIDAAMTPATLIKSVEMGTATATGRFQMIFKDADLAKVAFTADDSTRMVIGLKLRSPTPSGAYLGSILAGDATPLFITYTQVDVADTALQHTPLQRTVEQNLNLREVPDTPSPDLLRVGGFPAARALIRFAIPDYIRDSATIVRATLELVPDAPIVGVPGDSARIDAFGLLTDFGAKSPVNQSRQMSTWIHPGSDTVRVDIAPIVDLWLGTSTYPNAVRVQLGQEFASFLVPRFRSTRSPGGGPRLRITYRPPYAVENF